MASSYHNLSTSTLVSLLEILFNIISCFSNHLAYLPNAPQCSRWIYQRGQSFLRSPSSTIQPGWTALPVSGPSIITVDNDPNWEDTSATNSITNLTANRPTSSNSHARITQKVESGNNISRTRIRIHRGMPRLQDKYRNNICVMGCFGH